MDTGEQVENITSPYGMAATFAQKQEFHQEITRRNPNQTTSVLVQEDYLTPIVNCLPGECRITVCRSRSRPATATANPRSLSHRKIRSDANLRETRNVAVRFVTNEFQHGDVLLRQQQPTKMLKPEKMHFAPRRQWFVYSLTETIITGSQDGTTTTTTTTAETMQESELSTCTTDEGVESDRKSTSEQKTGDVSPSFTLKDIISLTERVFHNDSGMRTPDGRKTKCRDPSLGYYLEKLMEEKKNYLNLQKTKNFRKAQKVNFIADSFNFFNLLNKEFLSMKTSNPSIEKLRNVIAENKDSKMEEYLDMYKKVIRTSLTEPEQCLMDKAKMDLERYTDMYYDLMKYICTEKEEKTEGKGKSVCGNPLRSPKSGNNPRINYYEILKQDVRRNINWGSTYMDRIKPRLERSYYMTKIEENRRNREFNTGRTSYRTHNPRKGKKNEKDVSKKQIVELLSPPKVKESSLRKDTGNVNGQGKVVLTISVCNDGLIIKQVSESAKCETDTTNSFSEEDKKPKEKEPTTEEDKYSCSRNSVSEANLVASVGTSSDEVEKTQSELMLKTESDMTVYPKSSIDEESSEGHVEHPMLKFRAFRKLLNEGLKYLTSFGESPETDGHDCPKIPKGGKVPETHAEPIKYPKTTIAVKEPEEKETKKFFDECRPGHQKSTYIRDPRQTILRSPVRSRMNDVQEEKARRLLKRNLPSFSRGVSPNKISKRESSGEESSKRRKGQNFWWRNEGNAVSNTCPIRQRKTYRPPLRKVEPTNITKRISLLSKTFKESETSTPRCRRKTDERKHKESGKKVENELQEKMSDYATPTGSFLNWEFGMQSLKDLLSETPTDLLNPGGVTSGKLICQEETEEQEIQKTDLENEKNEESPPKSPSKETETLKLCCNNPLRAEWDRLVDASFQKDYHKVSEVLNQFMGNISEAWKAAKYLKDLIKPKSLEEAPKEEAPAIEEISVPQGEDVRESNLKNKAIESFRNFLRILTNVFESNQEETSVRRELFLVMKEVVESSSVKDVLSEVPHTGSRTIYHEEISKILEEVRSMVAEELVAEGRVFSRTKEDYEPESFVTAVKNVGEKLKNQYFAEEECQIPEKKVSEETPKALDLPTKMDVQGHQQIKSNLQSLAKKLSRIYGEQSYRKVVQSQSSVYFDAPDRFYHEPDRVPLNTVDESYFALSGKTFGKYRDMIYDKIIAFLKSDNPHNINYGMALLGKMMEKDEKPTRSKLDEDREKKWYDLVDRLMEMCHVIESEMREQVEKKVRGDEKEVELARTCEYLKSHVDKMKVMMEEMKAGQRKETRSMERVQALEDSRQTNMERQLMTTTEKPVNQQKYLDNAMTFINSIGVIGCSIDKFSKNFIYNWFLGTRKEDDEDGANPEEGEEERATTPKDSEEFKDSCDSVLEWNKTVVMNLKKSIERRQKRIKEMMEEAEKEGTKREEKLTDERLSRKVRDVKKCYNLLEKMICDPTMVPPKWLKDGEDGFNRKITPETDFQVMSMIQEVVAPALREKRLIKWEKNVFDDLPIAFLPFVNDTFRVGCDFQVQGQGVIFKRSNSA